MMSRVAVVEELFLPLFPALNAMPAPEKRLPNERTNVPRLSKTAIASLLSLAAFTVCVT
jgi:hypothetical protein